MAAIRIRQDRFGRWSGYIGVELHGRFDSEAAARDWMLDKMDEKLRKLPRNASCGRKGFTFKYTDKPKG
jgi:hypothetical protein